MISANFQWPGVKPIRTHLLLWVSVSQVIPDLMPIHCWLFFSPLQLFTEKNSRLQTPKSEKKKKKKGRMCSRNRSRCFPAGHGETTVVHVDISSRNSGPWRILTWHFFFFFFLRVSVYGEDLHWSRYKMWGGSSSREELLWINHSPHFPFPLPFSEAGR